MVSLGGTITAVQGMLMVVTVVVTNHSPWPMTFHVRNWHISTGGWNPWDVGTTHQPTQFSLAPFGTCELSFMIEFSGGDRPSPSMVGGRASVILYATVTILYLTESGTIRTPY
jgi:hypothetical protein